MSSYHTHLTVETGGVRCNRFATVKWVQTSNPKHVTCIKCRRDAGLEVRPPIWEPGRLRLLWRGQITMTLDLLDSLTAGPNTVRELALDIGRDRQTTAQALRRLRTAGLAAYTPGEPNTGRGNGGQGPGIYTITEAGRKAHADTWPGGSNGNG